jgi:hypothetical protein
MAFVCVDRRHVLHINSRRQRLRLPAGRVCTNSSCICSSRHKTLSKARELRCCEAAAFGLAAEASAEEGAEKISSYGIAPRPKGRREGTTSRTLAEGHNHRALRRANEWLPDGAQALPRNETLVHSHLDFPNVLYLDASDGCDEQRRHQRWRRRWRKRRQQRRQRRRRGRRRQ